VVIQRYKSRDFQGIDDDEGHQSSSLSVTARPNLAYHTRSVLGYHIHTGTGLIDPRDPPPSPPSFITASISAQARFSSFSRSSSLKCVLTDSRRGLAYC